MNTSKYANIKDLAIEFLGESFGQITYGIVPEKNHVDEVFCHTCGDIAAQYMVEGKATFHETILACKLAGEMIADNWETRHSVDEVMAVIDVNEDDCDYDDEDHVKDEDRVKLGLTFASVKKQCYAEIGELINERACNGKIYNACIEQIVDILDDLSYKTVDTECAILCAMMNMLKALLEKTEK